MKRTLAADNQYVHQAALPSSCLLYKQDTHFVKEKRHRNHVKAINAKKQTTAVHPCSDFNDKDYFFSLDTPCRVTLNGLCPLQCVYQRCSHCRNRDHCVPDKSKEEEASICCSHLFTNTAFHPILIGVAVSLRSHTKAVCCLSLSSRVFFGQTACRGLLSGRGWYIIDELSLGGTHLSRGWDRSNKDDQKPNFAANEKF